MKGIIKTKNKLAISFFFLIQILFCYGKSPVQIAGAEKIFNQYKVRGSILIFDENKKEYLGYNPIGFNKGISPASTFKIPNTLIALETDVITPDSIFQWNGEKRRYPRWEADMNIREAYRVSNVPIYQDIARSIGLERMKEYVRILHYGEMDIHSYNLDRFWLEGNSTVTLYQQIEFLIKLHNLQLPLRDEVMEVVKDIMIQDKNEKYTLRAKTGWIETDTGWYIGYYETTDNVYYFATAIDPISETDMEQFGNIRLELTNEIFSSLDFF